MALMGDN